MIGDTGDHTFGLLQQPHGNLLSRLAELDRIAQKIRPDLAEQILAARDAHGIKHRVEADILLRPLRLERDNRLADLLV